MLYNVLESLFVTVPEPSHETLLCIVDANYLMNRWDLWSWYKQCVHLRDFAESYSNGSTMLEIQSCGIKVLIIWKLFCRCRKENSCHIQMKLKWYFICGTAGLQRSCNNDFFLKVWCWRNTSRRHILPTANTRQFNRTHCSTARRLC